jgi:4-diphosphocytidyl-2-C-methyl-D-erythritol kinase
MTTEPAGVSREGSDVLPATVFAPAKLTLSLRITGVRSDGYHLIDAEMVTLDFGDDLRLADGDGLEVVDPATGEPIDIGPPESNLITRALRTVGRRCSVSVQKRIPAGAGLGGGSADAGVVEFVARCRDSGRAQRMHETSRFVREQGRWYYVDGIVDDKA